ncbi:hypothetical protein [Paraburkholderia tagetis]|uniref:Uncharacterized protein n=1 Tax=Paraburkholderia tagetis TaxID=2913261 RepID=A0A9X1RRH9_9BURK|nr:hypothetical protein [Paraburkholderia tagetis]MCG5073923.1 hypothetical protein [Paraburkholderia tagetis]
MLPLPEFMSLHAVTEPDTAAIVKQTRQARTIRNRFMVISRVRRPGKKPTRKPARPLACISWEKRTAGA